MKYFRIICVKCHVQAYRCFLPALSNPVRYTLYISSRSGRVIPVNPSPMPVARINLHATCDNWQMLMTLLSPPLAILSAVSLWGRRQVCWSTSHQSSTKSSYLGQSLSPLRNWSTRSSQTSTLGKRSSRGCWVPQALS